MLQKILKENAQDNLIIKISFPNNDHSSTIWLFYLPSSSWGLFSRYSSDVVIDERESSLKDINAMFFSNFLNLYKFRSSFARLFRI